MQINKTILCLFLFVLSAASCGLAKIKTGKITGLFSGYTATYNKYPGLLVKADASTALCDLKYSEASQVYIIKGEQLKQCLADHDDAIVYIWSSNCGGDQCFSPSLLQNFCDQENVELFIVAEYYEGEDLTQFYEIERPLFGIDVKHYKVDIVDMYVRKFENDLSDTKHSYGRMLYFKRGEYIGSPTIEFVK